MTMRLPPLTAGYGSGPALGTYTATRHPGHSQATALAGQPALRQMAGPLHTAPPHDQSGVSLSGNLEHDFDLILLRIDKDNQANPNRRCGTNETTCWGREETPADLDYRCCGPGEGCVCEPNNEPGCRPPPVQGPPNAPPRLANGGPAWISQVPVPPG